MYDSLDTMLLMGLHEEFATALPVIQASSFTTVRALFSLLHVTGSCGTAS